MNDDPRFGPSRQAAELSAAYQRFAQTGAHPHFTSWRVQQGMPAANGGRLEVWVDVVVVAQSPFSYPRVLAVFAPDDRLLAIIAAEAMPSVHDDVYLGMFADGQHNNFGADRALLDASPFLSRATDLANAVLGKAVPSDIVLGDTVFGAPVFGGAVLGGSGPDVSRIGPGVADELVVVDTPDGKYLIRDLLAIGGFGAVYGAISPSGEHVVAKVAHERGGSLSRTRGEVYPTAGFGFDTGSVHHHSFSGAEMDAVFRVEADLLERADGDGLPRLLAEGRLNGRPVLLMERLAGPWDPRTATPYDFGLLLGALESLAESIDYHGDLKPEHIFYDMDDDRYTFVDPAYREDERLGMATYEFNPLRLTGPASDVFAVAMMLFMHYAGRLPIHGARNDVELLASVRGVPSGDAGWVDRLLQCRRPVDLPEWVHDYDRAWGELLLARRPAPAPAAAPPVALPRLRMEPQGRILAGVSAVVPEGWFYKESVTLLAPDGQSNVIVSSEPLDPHLDTTHYATTQGELLRREFSGFVEFTFEPFDFASGQRGYLREFQWAPPDGRLVRQLQVYYVEAGRGYTATATVAADLADARRETLYDVLRTVAVGAPVRARSGMEHGPS